MRTYDEQLGQVMARASRLRAHASARRAATFDAVAAAVCLALLCFVFTTIPRLDTAASDLAGAQYGSLVLTGPALSYVVICVLAFLLGVFVTLLVMHVRRWRGK